MFFSFVYLTVRALLGLLVGSRHGPDIKDSELMILRHELDVLRRQVARPALRRVDRAFFAAAVCHLPRSSRSVRLVTPRTLLRWHHALVRTTSRHEGGRPGRPQLSAEIQSSCCASLGRTRAGVTGASAESSPSSACRHPRRVSVVCLLVLDCIRRRGAWARAGASFCTSRQRASSPATSLRSRRARTSLLRSLLHRARQPSRSAWRLYHQPGWELGRATGVQTSASSSERSRSAS